MVSEISILIPVYNQDVTALVEALLNETPALAIPFEVRVYDDGSNQETLQKNRWLQNIANVVYQELPENVGRSQIRQLLAQDARFKYLLFLDNDVMPVRQDFLKVYVSISGGAVTVGGVCYKNEAPPGFELRWKYGKAREEALAHVRQKNPYQRVFSSNFMVEKEVFLKYFPRNELNGYGHEDTLFAWRLEQNQILVQHIENPVWHLGLEPAEVFLLKTQQALHNLVRLDRQFNLGNGARLFMAYAKLKKWGMNKLLQENATWLFPFLKRNLLSKKPNLRLFDLYRLLLLQQYLKK